MRAGELRHKITIERPTNSQSSSGAVTQTWSTFAEAWADYKPMTGSEVFRMDQEVAEGRARFIIRYLAGLTNKMRIMYDSRYFDIETIINNRGRNRYLEILTREVAT